MEDLKSQVQAAFEGSLGHGHFTPRAFQEATGLHLDEAAYIFAHINSSSNITVKQFLLIMNFMKEYRSEAIAGLPFDILSNSTYEEILWPLLQMIDMVLPAALSTNFSFYFILYIINYL